MYSWIFLRASPWRSWGCCSPAGYGIAWRSGNRPEYENAAALLEEYSMKRIISFFLCILMTAALLAGCGDRKQRTTWIIAVDGDFSPLCAPMRTARLWAWMWSSWTPSPGIRTSGMSCVLGLGHRHECVHLPPGSGSHGQYRQLSGADRRWLVLFPIAFITA